MASTSTSSTSSLNWWFAFKKINITPLAAPGPELKYLDRAFAVKIFLEAASLNYLLTEVKLKDHPPTWNSDTKAVIALLDLFKWFLKPPIRLSESIKAMRWACVRLSKPLIKTTHLVVGLIGFASSYYLVWMYRTNFLLTSRKCKVFTDILPLLYLTSTHCSQAIFLRLFLLYLCLLSCYLLVFCWWVTQSHHPMRLSMSTTRMTLSQRILARLRPPRLLSLEPKQRTKTCPRVSPSNNNSKLHCSFCKQDGHNLEQCSTAWEILDENHSCPTRNWQDHQFGSKKSGKSAKAGKVETTTIEGGSCQALSPNPGTIGVQKITTHGSVSRAILVTRLIQLMVQCQEL